jgi:hypothetical protein
MIPRGGEGVAHLGARIMADLVPRAVDAYSMSDLAIIATLVGLIAEDYDRAADVLLADEVDMRAIFAAAEANVTDPDLRRRLATSLATPPEGWRVSQLSERGDAAMRVLIDLHSVAETAMDAGEDWAVAINARIWTFLERHVDRRAYHAAL